MLITLVLGHYISIEVNKYIGVLALHPLSLIACVEGATVDAAVEHVVLFFEKELKFFHVEFAHQFIFFVSQFV